MELASAKSNNAAIQARTGKLAQASVVIVAYQRDAQLQRALESIFAQTLPREALEICVVDNGAACTEARAQFEPLVDVWIASETNLGASGGRNLAAQNCSAPLLVFIDDDGVAHPEFVEAMLQTFAADAQVTAARGRVLPLQHPWFTAAATHYNGGDEPCEAFLDIEGATAIRRHVFLASGGYDPNIYGHEGIELCLRMLQVEPQGRVVYVPNAILYHDFFSNWAQLLAKAKRMATTETRTCSLAARIHEARQRFQRRGIPDGRSLLQRAIGACVRWTFQYAKRHYTRSLRRSLPTRSL
jgi:glycosyltransferase involved in cell wall biosynthesis